MTKPDETHRLAETHVIPFLSILKELPPEMLKHLDNFHFENDFQTQASLMTQP